MRVPIKLAGPKPRLQVTIKAAHAKDGCVGQQGWLDMGLAPKIEQHFLELFCGKMENTLRNFSFGKQLVCFVFSYGKVFSFLRGGVKLEEEELPMSTL